MEVGSRAEYKTFGGGRMEVAHQNDALLIAIVPIVQVFVYITKNLSFLLFIVTFWYACLRNIILTKHSLYS